MNYDDESLWIAMLMDDEQKLMMKEMVFEILLKIEKANETRVPKDTE